MILTWLVYLVWRLLESHNQGNFSNEIPQKYVKIECVTVPSQSRVYDLFGAGADRDKHRQVSHIKKTKSSRKIRK
jgi:hypothetical protein